MASDGNVGRGDLVLLHHDQRRQWLVRVEERTFHTHKGYLQLSELLKRRYGEAVETSLGRRLWILRPTLTDIIMNIERPTQILYPKEVGFALVYLGVKPGSKVLEAGTGSGAMTIALANAVGKDGHVYSYEARPEFLQVAKKNLAFSGLEGRVTLKLADASQGFDEKEFDAGVVDLGEPWAVVPGFRTALKGGGPLVSFSPTFNQVEKMVRAMNETGFVGVQSMELLLRELRVDEGKTRPATRMIGHTTYVTFGRTTSS